jgi:hypothetical protein
MPSLTEHDASPCSPNRMLSSVQPQISPGNPLPTTYMGFPLEIDSAIAYGILFHLRKQALSTLYLIPVYRPIAMPCDVWNHANVYARVSQPNMRQFAEVVIIFVRAENIGVIDVILEVPQSLVATDRIASRTIEEDYSPSGIPRNGVF